MDKSLPILENFDPNKIEVGSTGYVYFTKDKAVKIYHKPEDGGDDMEKSQAAEFKVTKRLLNHPNPRFVSILQMGNIPAPGLKVKEENGAERLLTGNYLEKIVEKNRKVNKDLAGTLERRYVEMERLQGPTLTKLTGILAGISERPATEQDLEDWKPYKKLFASEWDLLKNPDKNLRIQAYQRAAIRAVAEYSGIVEEFHQLGFLHRDIKPEAVSLEDRGLVMFDFGSALSVRNNPLEEESSKTTNGFIAPEISTYLEDLKNIPNSVYSPQSEVYALAQTLIYLIQGGVGHIGASAELEFTDEQKKTLDPLLLKVLELATENEKEKRFLTPRHLMLVLEFYLSGDSAVETDLLLKKYGLSPEEIKNLKGMTDIQEVINEIVRLKPVEKKDIRSAEDDSDIGEVLRAWDV